MEHRTAPASSPPSADTPRFLVLLHPCRDDFWTTLTPEETEVVRAHYERLAALQDAGLMEFGGRSKDNRYGLLILRMPSADSVREVFADNPAVRAGLLRVEVQAYNLSLDEQDD